MPEDTTVTEVEAETQTEAPSPESTAWFDGLPDEFKSAPVVRDSPDLPTFVKTAISAQKMVGADKVVLPAKEDDEAWGTVFNKLGRPETPDKYALPDDIEMPEGAAIPEESIRSFMDRAHALGLTQRQLAGVYRWFAEDVSQAHEQAQSQTRESTAQSIATLKREFGQAYEERLSMARQALKQFGGEELTAMLEDTGLGNDPRVVRTFAAIGKALADDKLYHSGDTIGSGRLTPDEARREAQKLQGDTEFLAAYTDNQHPGHDEAVAKITELYKLGRGG